MCQAAAVANEYSARQIYQSNLVKPNESTAIRANYSNISYFAKAQHTGSRPM